MVRKIDLSSPITKITETNASYRWSHKKYKLTIE
jgi:hypothetical protein